jgi:hypothetical protein
MSNISRRSALHAVAIAVLLATASVSSPASADVEAVARQCLGQPCAWHQPTVATPAGWTHDGTAEERLRMEVLVRAGQSFISTDAYILGGLMPNPAGQTVAQHVGRRQAVFLNKDPSLAITALPDVVAADGKTFRIVQLTKPSKPGYTELVATTADTDRDGNPYIVDISLAGTSAEAFAAAREVYLGLLRSY